ncbi:MAG: hypothetical protein EA419_07135, partial [Wenzhouxiangella sp.]
MIVKRQMIATLVCTFAMLSASAAQADNNDELGPLIIALNSTHAGALVLSFSPDPFVQIPASAVTFGTNLGLKSLPAVFFTPGDWSDEPNSPDSCTYDFDLPQSSASFSNLLGFINLENVPKEWGDLTRFGPAVEVFHLNTDVDVSVSNRHIEPDRVREVCTFPANVPFLECEQKPPQQVRLPSGQHRMLWRADTQLSQVFDVIVPAVFLGFNIGRYGASWANQGKDATRQLFIQEKVKRRIFSAAVQLGILADGAFEIFGTETSATHEREQIVTIYKVVPPEISTSQPVITLEATDFGGVLYERVRDQLRASIDASDPCGALFTLGNDAGPLLNTGNNVLTWTIRDSGPLPGGGFNSDYVIQQVMVEDTQAPILVPPPSRVIEVPPSTSGLAADEVVLGAARVVDLADPDPAVSNDGPAFYPINSRSAVTWTATDESGNSSVADQLITIKAEGTNNSPTVSNVATSTLTSQPVDIVLSGQDPDFLDGRYDPLSFRISQRPASGEFVAPLYPFFIEDYRTTPGGPYGEEFYLSNNKASWMWSNVCQVLPGPNADKIEVDWVDSPHFVHVDDQGKVYMVDRYWQCGSSDASTTPRISTWDQDGNFIGQINYHGFNNAFVLDRDDFIYEIDSVGSGSSREIFINRCATDFVGKASRADFCQSLGRVRSNSAPDIQMTSVSYARVDSSQDLLYVTDKKRVFVFDIRNDPPDPVYLATLNPDEPFVRGPSCAGSSSLGYAMEVDSEGSLYMVNCFNHRIEKFSASTFDEQGNLVPGEYVGWMGRCETSSNNACDEDKQISRGFACTDATCTRTDSDGKEPGQFHTPLYVAIDPNDVLYVAEWDNSRVQRFAADGTFAGQARSTGTGINQGDHPGFVLGNMGRPRAVSVNASQFYVVDREEGFVHVFETSPLKDITDDSVTVTYVSKFDFHSDTDSFQFIASDGLADSNPGTVTIDVARNFRPPVAHDQDISTDEDAPIDIVLTADDPDGIVGIDFNGLDILTYRIVDPPEHGMLSLVESDNATATYTYTPDPDYFGQDRFTFVANDAVDDSNLAEVVIEVIYVDDPPVIVDVELPPRVGLGFPFVVRGVFTDDGSANPDDYFTTVVWTSNGQSQTVVEGGINEDDPDNPFLEGVLLIRPPQGRGTGYGIAQNVFTTPGTRQVRFCILDQNAGDTPCQTREFVAE